jgi:adenylate cyclase
VALRHTAEVLQVAELAADDFNLVIARLTRGIVLAHSQSAEDRMAGLDLLAMARETAVRGRFYLLALPVVDTEMAKDKARAGDLDTAITLSQKVLDSEFDAGEMIYRGSSASVLVESLLRRDHAGDLAHAQATIDRLASVPTDPGFVLYEIPLLRLNALVAQHRGDRGAYIQWVDRYRAKAASCGFAGHVAIADQM